MGTLSSGVGLVSGIDIRGLVDQLIQIEARPLRTLQSRNEVLQAQKTAFLDISARLLGLKFNSTSFDEDNTFNKKNSTSSNESVLKVTASDDASPGTFNLTVSRLVTSQQLISSGFGASNEVVTGSSKTLTFESIDGRLDRDHELAELNAQQGISRGSIRITDRTGSTADVDLGRVVTLNDVMDEINNAAGVNVTATMDGDGLLITDNTGSTSSNLIISDLGSSGTATSLGIAGSVAGTTLTGSQINMISSNSRLIALNDGNGVRTSGGTDLKITTKNGDNVNVDLSDKLFLSGTTDVTDLNSGTGVGLSGAGNEDITIRTRDNNSFDIDLGAASTVQDLVDAINNDADNSGTVTASIASDNVSLKLVDNTGGTSINFQVTTHADASGLSLDPATDLGLNQSVSTNTIDGTTIFPPDRATTIQDVVDRINESLTDAGVATSGASGFIVEVDSSTNNRLKITDNTAGAGTTTITTDTASGRVNTARDLGIDISSTSTTFTGERIIANLGSKLIKNLNGGADSTAPTPGQVTFQTHDGTSTTRDFSSFSSIDEIVDDINSNVAGVTAALNTSGNGLTLSDTTSGGTDFSVTDGDANNFATFLNIAQNAGTSSTIESDDLDVRHISEATLLSSLNNGKGLTRGRFSITDSNGNSGTVDLTQGNELTIADVISEINSRPTDIVARINDTGDGLFLSDTTGGSLTIKVEESGSSTAKELGILGTSSSNANGSNQIDGSFERTVSLDADDTLEDIISKVNSADVGVSASLVNDGSGIAPYRAIFTSENTGTSGQFLFDDQGLGLNSSTLVKGSDAVAFFGSTDPAQAILITGSTNTLTDTIPGVTLDLVGTSSQAVEVSISKDTATITDALRGFVDNFNTVMDGVRQYDSYNSSTEERGLLLGNPIMGVVRSRMFGALNGSQNVGGNLSFFSQIGITVGTGSQLRFDEAKFTSALANDFESVEKLVVGTYDTAADGTKSNFQGLGAVFNDLLDRLTDSFDGTLTLASNSIDAQVEQTIKRAEDINKRLESKRARLEGEFFAMERALAGLQTQQQSLGSLSSIATSFQLSGLTRRANSA